MSAEAYPASELQIQAAPDSLSTYTFGSGKAKHQFCKHCGIYTFHETFRFPGHYRVNLGCIDEVDTLNLDIELFDGKSLL